MTEFLLPDGRTTVGSMWQCHHPTLVVIITSQLNITLCGGKHDIGVDENIGLRNKSSLKTYGFSVPVSLLRRMRIS